jgi:hypothetical protein
VGGLQRRAAPGGPLAGRDGRPGPSVRDVVPRARPPRRRGRRGPGGGPRPRRHRAVGRPGRGRHGANVVAVDPFDETLDPFDETLDPFDETLDPFDETLDPFDETLDPATDRGAAATVNADAVDDVPGEAAAVTDGGADVPVDALGTAETCRNPVRTPRKRGQQLQFGLPSRAEGGEVSLPTDPIVATERRFVGSIGTPRPHYDGLFRTTEQGTLDPAALVSGTLPLERVPATLDAVTDYGTVGIPVVDEFRRAPAAEPTARSLTVARERAAAPRRGRVKSRTGSSVVAVETADRRRCQLRTTFVARGPFGACSMSNSISCPSSRSGPPTSSMWKKTSSSASSVEMKP